MGDQTKHTHANVDHLRAGRENRALSRVRLIARHHHSLTLYHGGGDGERREPEVL